MKKLLILYLTFTIATELEVDGNLKVTGTVDANGNPITNVGEPVFTTDVATANYVLERTTTKGRIIVLKCPWINSGEYVGADNFCEPPACPEGWNELATFNEITALNGMPEWRSVAGNSVKYCMEQETE
tara:strand:+ start:520 stop:906 length:387 start_codon:yes stop_codon:yes gene_type:complete